MNKLWAISLIAIIRLLIFICQLLVAMVFHYRDSDEAQAYKRQFEAIERLADQALRALEKVG